MLPRRIVLVPLALAACLALPGCYKGQMEAEKSRADAAEQRVKELEGQLQAARSESSTARGAIEQLKANATLVTIVAGQVAGRDAMRLNDRGEFVRHGARWRPTSNIRFENGLLADQRLIVNRDDGTRSVEGDVRAGRPDGEWIWYTKDGKPGTRELWQGGRLAEVSNASSIASDGKVTWKAMSKAERDNWARATAPVFMNLPELVRDTTPPAPATPTTPPGAPVRPGTSPTPAAKGPAKGATPAKGR